MVLVTWLNKLQDELYESGQNRLAELIDEIPHLAHQQDINDVEALIPEAIAGARAIKNSWLEIYFRHWDMRNRLDKKLEGSCAQKDVVSLLELAHRPENIDCPHSICTTHDISGCYSNMDGPGWADDRKAVCLETLERINPKWPCYVCLNAEYMDALLDEKKYEEVILRADETAMALKMHGEEPDDKLEHVKISALTGLGRYEEALALLNKVDEDDLDEGYFKGRVAWRYLMRCRLLAELGSANEAWNLFNERPEIIPGHYPSLCITSEALVRADPELNSWEFGAFLQNMLNYFDQMNTHRFCVDFAVLHGELALERNAFWTATRALQLAQKHLPKLNAPLGADQKIAELEAKINNYDKSQIKLPVPAEKLMEYLSETKHANAEEGVEWMLLVLKEHPDSVSTVLSAASAMKACNELNDGANLLYNFLKKSTEFNVDVFLELLQMYLGANKNEEAEALVAEYDGSLPAAAHWGRCVIASYHNDWSAVEVEGEAALKLMPGNQSLMFEVAHATLQTCNFQRSIELYRELEKLAEANGEEDRSDFKWRQMIGLSALEDWDGVRTLAKQLDIKLKDDTGPINEDWGWIKMLFWENNDWKEHYARRTGPCTARVLSVAAPGKTQHVNDLVVFDPRYIESLPEDEESRDNYIAPHYVVHVIKSANYKAWICDGAHPGEDEFDKFSEFLDEKGIAVRIYQDEDYNIHEPGEPEDIASLPGIYFVVATPPEMDLAEANALLLEATKKWKHPIMWMELARAAKADITRHEAIRDRYSL